MCLSRQGVVLSPVLRSKTKNVQTSETECEGAVILVYSYKQYIRHHTHMCHRWLLRWTKRKNEEAEKRHPAVRAVKNYLSGSERCLVVWGVHQSQTFLCCEVIASGVNREGGLAKWFRCDEMIRTCGRSLLKKLFLERIGCKTLDDFARLLPENKKEHTWLIFDAVDIQREDEHVTGFFNDLIELSYSSAKFKILLFTHNAGVACSVLQWSTLQRPIQLVEPITCCRWNSPACGCPGVDSDAVADELEALWALGNARLTTFIRDQRRQ